MSTPDWSGPNPRERITVERKLRGVPLCTSCAEPLSAVDIEQHRSTCGWCRGLDQKIRENELRFAPETGDPETRPFPLDPWRLVKDPETGRFLP